MKAQRENNRPPADHEADDGEGLKALLELADILVSIAEANEAEGDSDAR